MDLTTALYKKLYLLRRSEVAIRDYYSEDDMKTPMHMSMGSEAISVGMCHAMSDSDTVFGTYRSHALYLAKTGDVRTFFAEMYGKKSGCSKGKSGSMHLCGPNKGHLGSSAVVGSHLAAGVGAAFAHKYTNNGSIAAAFFGDAATDEGIFWESLNIACLMRLPMLFVCENNGLSVHTPNKIRRGYKCIDNIVEQFDCKVIESTATDVEKVYCCACEAKNNATQNQKPVFLHLKYYRYLEHVGVSEDFDAGYRAKSEYEEWLKQDPIDKQRERLSLLGHEDAIAKIEAEIDNRVIASVNLAKEEPFCDKGEVMRDIFCENS